MTLEHSIGTRCNIGPAEIARRRRTALLLTAATVTIAAALVVFPFPPVARLAIWPVATAAAVTWLQVVHRFCVAFGALGLENFAALGSEHAVDPAQRAGDRRRAAQLIVEGSLIGTIVALGLLVAPLR